MTMLQGLRQQSVRDLTETAGSYESDWHALFDLYGITAGPFNGRLLEWLNLQMATTIADLPGAMQAFAVTQGVTNWSSMGTWALTSPSTTLFAEMSTEPTGPRKALIDRTIRSLVSSGVWAKLDAYIEAGHDEQASLLNWKTPGTFNATNTNSMTFAADAGWTGDGSTSYLNSGLTPNAGGTNYVLNSASVGMWSRTSAGSDAMDLGRAGSSLLRTQARIRNVAGNADFVKVNDTTNSTPGAITSGAGYFVIDRPSSSVKRVFKDGAQVGADIAINSVLLSDNALAIGADTPTSFSSRQFAGYHIGGSLSVAEQAALYAIRLTYRQGVGFA